MPFTIRPFAFFHVLCTLFLAILFDAPVWAG
jgi:hypothetical protein